MLQEEHGNGNYQGGQLGPPAAIPRTRRGGFEPHVQQLSAIPCVNRSGQEETTSLKRLSTKKTIFKTSGKKDGGIGKQGGNLLPHIPHTHQGSNFSRNN